VAPRFGPVQRDVPEVHPVVRERVVAEGWKAALAIADARRHRQQVANGDLSEFGIPRRQLGQVLGDPIVDASDQPFVDRDSDERRHNRLRGRERGLQALAARAAEVTLVHQAVSVDDEKRERVHLAQELVQVLPFAAKDDIGLDAARKRTRASTCRDGSGREPLLVAHVRLAPDQRPSERGIVGRQPRPAVDAKRRPNEHGEAARDQEPPPRPPRLRFHRLTNHPSQER
jgi:hypothetical protein